MQLNGSCLPTNGEVDLWWCIKSPHAHNGRQLQILQWDLNMPPSLNGFSCREASTGSPKMSGERTHHISFPVTEGWSVSHVGVGSEYLCK